MINRYLISPLVYSNLWISAGSLLFTALFYLLVDVPYDFHYLGFVFFSTLLTYTFQRYMKIVYKENVLGPRMEWMKRNVRLVQTILFIGLVGTTFYALYLSLSSLFILAIMGAISFFYAFKFNLTNRKTNLRDIPGIKIYLIGLVWAICCALIPMVELELLNSKTIQICLGFLLFIIGITIPFDIRDVDVDEINKKTIPQMIGVKWSKVIAILLVTGSFWLMSGTKELFYPSLTSSVISAILIAFARTKNNELYFSFIMDGLLVVVPLVFYLFQSL